jgi:hypothetical protein
MLLNERHDVAPAGAFLTRAVGAVLALIGLVLLIGGVWLVAAGGSPYYLIAGLGLLVSGGLLLLLRPGGIWIYAAVWIATIVWAIWEVGAARLGTGSQAGGPDGADGPGAGDRAGADPSGPRPPGARRDRRRLRADRSVGLRRGGRRQPPPGRRPLAQRSHGDDRTVPDASGRRLAGVWRDLQRPALFAAGPDHTRQRRQAAARLDLPHRRPARRRLRALEVWGRDDAVEGRRHPLPVHAQEHPHRPRPGERPAALAL